MCPHELPTRYLNYNLSSRRDFKVVCNKILQRLFRENKVISLKTALRQIMLQTLNFEALTQQQEPQAGTSLKTNVDHRFTARNGQL